MKIVIPTTLLALGVLTLFSCKKDHKSPTQTDDKLYTLNFSTKPKLTTMQSKLAVNSTDTALTKNVKYLTYLLYDSQGNLKKQVNQDSASANFGTFTTQVPNGTFYAYFLGNSTIYGASVRLSDNIIYRDSRLDMFYKADTVVVNGSNVNGNVTMNRISSLLELNIEDAIPNVISGISITDFVPAGVLLLKDTTYATINSSPDYGYLHSYLFTNAQKGTHNVKIRMAVFVPQVLHTITLNIIENGRYIGHTITIKNVRFMANAKTILSGTVFDKAINNQGDFHISIEPGWDTINVNL
ncbi:hypothetical protein ACEN9X_18885 [Mucilaginibacter sp. Mucisp86]|uniref:hypothetical protein n=1 Tax=Mucilaginibacter sp. Mucisp86 TaxID=3243060 RepID=UPI0039B51535